MADNQQAIGYVTQSALGSAGTVSAPLAGIRNFTNPARVESNSPHYKTNSAFNQTSIRVQTRAGAVEIEGDATPANVLPLAESAMGPASSGVVKAGVGTRKYLTVKFAEGLTQYWQGIDYIVDSLEFTYTIRDGLQFRATLLGPMPTVTASAWSTVAPAFSGVVPFANWQVYITRGGSAYCVRRLMVRVNNNSEAQYCSPQVLPDNSTLAGLTPTRYVYGDGEVAFEIEAKYDANASSIYAAFQAQTTEAWLIHALDPRTSATADMLFSLPITGYTDGEIQRERTNWQRMSGFALYYVTDATPFTLTVVA
jgi:hypothetical protein